MPDIVGSYMRDQYNSQGVGRGPSDEEISRYCSQVISANGGATDPKVGKELKMPPLQLPSESGISRVGLQKGSPGAGESQAPNATAAVSTRDAAAPKSPDEAAKELEGLPPKGMADKTKELIAAHQGDPDGGKAFANALLKTSQANGHTVAENLTHGVAGSLVKGFSDDDRKAVTADLAEIADVGGPEAGKQLADGLAHNIPDGLLGANDRPMTGNQSFASALRAEMIATGHGGVLCASLAKSFNDQKKLTCRDEMMKVFTDASDNIGKDPGKNSQQAKNMALGASMMRFYADKKFGQDNPSSWDVTQEPELAPDLIWQGKAWHAAGDILGRTDVHDPGFSG